MVGRNKVTLCDLIWHVSSLAVWQCTLQTAISIYFALLYFTLPAKRPRDKAAQDKLKRCPFSLAMALPPLTSMLDRGPRIICSRRCASPAAARLCCCCARCPWDRHGRTDRRTPHRLLLVTDYRNRKSLLVKTAYRMLKCRHQKCRVCQI